MHVAIIIPARYSSSRFPGKPLVGLKGCTGISKTLVRRTWEVACAVKRVDSVTVATDDSRIADEVYSFGGNSLLTSSHCKNGTERCHEASLLLDKPADIIVNVQGDAPLTPADFVERLIATMLEDTSVQVATPVLRSNGENYDRLVKDRMAGRVGGTTVVFDSQGRALYFSKNVIPWCNKNFEFSDPTPVYHHVGVYAYRREALNWYAGAGQGKLEQLEGLEQLRFLEGGLDIQCVEVDSRGRGFWELNNPSDVAIIEKSLAEANKV